MENSTNYTIFQWDIIISGYEFGKLISTRGDYYVPVTREGTGDKLTIKTTENTIIHYCQDEDDNYIHAYLYKNMDDEYEALAFLDYETEHMLSGVSLNKRLDVLKNFDKLSLYDTLSITAQVRNPRVDIYFPGDLDYPTKLFYETKYSICELNYTPAQKRQIRNLLTIMENKNDSQYSLADKKLSYIMRINSYTHRRIFTFPRTLSKSVTKELDHIQGLDWLKERIIDLLQAQEYSDRPLFILLVGSGPKSTIASAVAKSVKIPMSSILINNYSSEAELIGSETEASVIVKHWAKIGSTDSVIVLKEFDKFVNNNPVNADRFLSNFEDAWFSDKFTTTYHTGRSIIIATAQSDDLPADILNRFHVMYTDEDYTHDQKKKIIQKILSDILARYKIDSYNLNISNETIDCLAEEVTGNEFKHIEKNLELLIGIHSTELKRQVVLITMQDYYQVICNESAKPELIKENYKHGSLLKKLFEDIIDEE